MLFYLLAAIIVIVISIVEGDSAAFIIKQTGNVSHNITPRVWFLTVLSLICAGLLYDEMLWLLWLQIIIIGVNLSALYWVVFEMALNISMGWDVLHVGNTARTDIILRNVLGKRVEILTFILKLTLIIGSSLLI